MNAPAKIPIPPGRLMKRREVERELGIAKSTIYRWMDDGKFPRPVRIHGRDVRWPSSVIDQFKRENVTLWQRDP
ncbi:MAG: AlpA family phage regulatory protein [Pontixanthobacter sp.]